MARHKATAGPPPPPEENVVAPGYHESSWDLLRGLEVREDLPLDSRWPKDWLARRSRPSTSSPPDGSSADPSVPHDDFTRFDIDDLKLG